jgi:hypothetical protein
MSFKCNHCDNKYTKKSSLEKHKIICEYKFLTNREKKIDDEESKDIPNYEDLVKIVQILAIKCNQLEEKVKKLVECRKRKINIIDWLNKNIISTISYAEWVHMYFEIDAKYFQYLMEYNLYETIDYILKTNLKNNDDFIVPFKCFVEKNSVFYIVFKEGEKNIWKKAEHDDIVLLIRKIYNKLLNELTKWKKENENSFDDNPKLSEKFNKAVIKLMNISFNQNDAIFSRIRNILYNSLKTEFVEYEIEY